MSWFWVAVKLLTILNFWRLDFILCLWGDLLSGWILSPSIVSCGPFVMSLESARDVLSSSNMALSNSFILMACSCGLRSGLFAFQLLLLMDSLGVCHVYKHFWSYLRIWRDFVIWLLPILEDFFPHNFYLLVQATFCLWQLKSVSLWTGRLVLSGEEPYRPHEDLMQLLPFKSLV